MEDLNKKIYIVGHTKPDLDAIASAFGYQKFKEGVGEYTYQAIRCDRVNAQTEWVFKKYNTPLPEYIPDISGMNVVLVDHTFPESRAKGWENANIIEVIDHHDVKLEDIIPQSITIRPCGSTTSLIAQKIFKNGVLLNRNIASILLSAILDDTLGLKSPTTIKLDREMVNKLNEIAQIEDLDEYSKILFEKKDIWHTLSPKEIIQEDLREVEINGNWFSISQVETMNNRELKKDQIVNELEVLNKEIPFNLRLVMLTDLLQKNCILLVVGKDIPLLEKILNQRVIDNALFLPNVVSRKKQILPIFQEIYSK
ncbi:hypothetical protein GX618_02495 [Candidatus Dojkabacteria bacterium]|uniref:inorganic diphosphatase n=1 Tax=Candidatus Dojkabacteria bacterium TaxID=2099670 RepID=A0A847ETK2_9BACT|nr:hypothetical protein [Candidatus Dojkabacteria bacterium]